MENKKPIEEIKEEYYQNDMNSCTGSDSCWDAGFESGYHAAKKEEKDKLEKLKKALSFYAKPSVWGTDTPCMETSIDPCDQEYLDAYGTRGGKLARKILKEIE